MVEEAVEEASRLGEGAAALTAAALVAGDGSSLLLVAAVVVASAAGRVGSVARLLAEPAAAEPRRRMPRRTVQSEGLRDQNVGLLSRLLLALLLAESELGCCNADASTADLARWRTTCFAFAFAFACAFVCDGTACPGLGLSCCAESLSRCMCVPWHDSLRALDAVTAGVVDGVGLALLGAAARQWSSLSTESSHRSRVSSTGGTGLKEDRHTADRCWGLSSSLRGVGSGWVGMVPV